MIQLMNILIHPVLKCSHCLRAVCDFMAATDKVVINPIFVKHSAASELADSVTSLFDFVFSLQACHSVMRIS